ncbi:MAG TPA: hypothetical protein VH247_15645 [Thermoleophilaceae bacterium]|nr:hypothetical protein [Thermoleophilaceae bacterium]
MLQQLVAQDRQQVYLTHAGVCLRASDVDPSGGQVDVAPAKVCELSCAQTRERERRHHGATAIRARGLTTIEFGRGVEQGDDLAGRVQVDGPRPTDLQPAAATRRWVPGDQLVLKSNLEDLRESGERLVDRPRTDPAFAHLVLPVAVDLLNGDLVEAMLGKERQQVD